ncbi:MAG TPA: hypothetical protein VMW30_08305 [Candidatus Paceibacterota bacterium]|nr:hypothetical protein [Candidatus Paceibacterota bacterium]
MENTKLGPKGCEDQHINQTLSMERRLILTLLRRKKSAIRVQEMANELRLHENTVREHLDGLVLSHHARRISIPSIGRGRPSYGYEALNDFISQVEPAAREYASLAMALAKQLAFTKGNTKANAVSAGEEWAKVFRNSDIHSSLRPQQVRKRLIEVLTSLGFSPKPHPKKNLIRLETCPLLAAAREEPEVICSVHLGLIRGLVSHSGMNVNKVKLTQFAERGSCHLTLP